jgi:hypothetical protein
MIAAVPHRRIFPILGLKKKPARLPGYRFAFDRRMEHFKAGNCASGTAQIGVLPD